ACSQTASGKKPGLAGSPLVHFGSAFARAEACSALAAEANVNKVAASQSAPDDFHRVGQASRLSPSSGTLFMVQLRVRESARIAFKSETGATPVLRGGLRFLMGAIRELRFR